MKPWKAAAAGILLLGSLAPSAPAAGSSKPGAAAEGPGPAGSPASAEEPAPRENPKKGPTPPEPLLSIRAPDFEVYTLDRKPVHLSDHRGKVVLVNFWGIWCPPCRHEIPELKQLYAEMHPRGMELMGINSGDPWGRVPSFVEDQQINYPVLFDNGVVLEYGVEAFPTSLVIDQKGFIRLSIEGYHPTAVNRMRNVVRFLLEHP